MKNTLKNRIAIIAACIIAFALLVGIARADAAISANLVWTAPVGGGAPTGYKVYRGSTTTNLAVIATTSSTTYTNTGLAQGVTYYYAVTATNAVGESGFSPTGSLTTPATPNAPGGLTITLILQ